MRQRNCYLLLGFIALLSFMGCSTRQPPQPLGTGLKQLQELKPPKTSPRKKQGESNDLRKEALKETALTLGAQSGLAWRSKQINAELTSQTQELDRIFNFQALMLDDNVLPPVLQAGHDTINVADFDAIRMTDRTYRIIQQARFTTAPPTWRDYLWLQYAEPERPVNALLPKNKEERALWKQHVTEGWNLGIRQAEVLFQENFAKLQQAYQGMIIYKTLLAQGMVSKPYVAKANLGVTGDHTSLRVNDQILRITALPEMQPDSQLWQPALQQ